MLNCELYSIYTEDNEYRGSDKEFFYSYDDAYTARMKYANWYRPNGDVWIRHYDKTGTHCIEEWHIDYNGDIINRVKWEVDIRRPKWQKCF